MARSGRCVFVEAPVSIIDGTPIWFDKDWLVNFTAWLRQEKLKLSALEIKKNNKLKITFLDAKMALLFGLKYDSKKQKEIFRTKERP